MIVALFGSGLANAQTTGQPTGALPVTHSSATSPAPSPAQQTVAPPPATGAITAATDAAVANQPTPSISSYRINPGDEMEVYVWGEERLQRVLRVLPDGTIAFPLVGQLKVAGALPQDVERMVSDRLRSQYRGEVPVVTVSLRDSSGMKFSVMGKVRSPGTYNVGRYVNVLEALSLAGGPAEFANLDSVLIIREQGGKSYSTRVKLSQLFKSGATTADVEKAGIVNILPGDVIIVP